MVDNVGDRLERNEMVVMNARSRPTNEDVKAMADLFSYMYLVHYLGRTKPS